MRSWRYVRQHSLDAVQSYGHVRYIARSGVCAGGMLLAVRMFQHQSSSVTVQCFVCMLWHPRLSTGSQSNRPC